MSSTTPCFVPPSSVSIRTLKTSPPLPSRASCRSTRNLVVSHPPRRARFRAAAPTPTESNCPFEFDDPTAASLLRAPPSESPASLPVLLYIPGLDTAPLPRPQAARLRARFVIVSLCLHASDRRPWGALVDDLLPSLRALRVNSGHPIRVVAESFGAVLALALASASNTDATTGESSADPTSSSLFAHLTLLNPATSVASDAPLQALSSLLRVLRFNPTPSTLSYRAAAVIAFNTVLVDRARLAEPDDTASTGGGVTSFDTARAPLHATLHRLDLLRELPPTLADDAALASAVTVPVTLVASRRDRLLRSVAEARRLAVLLPTASDVVVLEESAHAALLEANVNLLELVNRSERAFLESARNSAAVNDAAHIDRASLVGDKPISSNQTGPSVDQVDLEKQLEDDRRYEAALRLGQEFYGPWRALVSPLVLGRKNVTQALRVAGKRPILFVGNHGVHGIFDTSLVFLELLDLLPAEARLRALADAAHFDQYDELSGGRWTQFADDLGAVQATARNYYRLLSEGARILLFPGGAREVTRRRGEQNTLVWKEGETQFVRPAARFDAVIVPFSAIGADDAVDIVLDGQELQRLPVVGPRVTKFAQDNRIYTETLCLSSRCHHAQTASISNSCPPSTSPTCPREMTQSATACTMKFVPPSRTDSWSYKMYGKEIRSERSKRERYETRRVECSEACLTLRCQQLDFEL